MNVTIVRALPRKIVAASITSVGFVLLLGLVQPNPFGEDISSISKYLEAFLIVMPMYLLYSFPAILIYGSLTSVLSDLFSLLIIKNRIRKTEFYLSLLFHMLFGLILLWVSLAASIIFFLTDRFLSTRKSVYTWGEALKSLIIPLLLWILFMGIIWIRHFIENWTDYMVLP